jgi:hypothetical protein
LLLPITYYLFVSWKCMKDRVADEKHRRRRKS